jgi:DNA-binding XRE family transcriptional regulator
LAFPHIEADPRPCHKFSFLKGLNRKKGLRGCGGFWQDMALAMLPIFILMKPKRVRKMAVPLGLIWWSHLKRHPLNKHAGAVVSQFRSDRGWSLEDLSKASGISPSYLCDLEHGHHSPSMEVQLRLEEVFGMQCGGLLRLARCEMRKAR